MLLNTLLWLADRPGGRHRAGLGLAVLIDQMKRESIHKSLIFMPMAVSFVGASIIWEFVYQHDQIGLLSADRHAPRLEEPAVLAALEALNNFLLMVILVWIQTGFAMVLLSAAIKAIPNDVIEAAELDGASGWRQFTYVTVPMIRPTLVVVLTTIMIVTLKLFDIIAATTGGNYDTRCCPTRCTTRPSSSATSDAGQPSRSSSSSRCARARLQHRSCAGRGPSDEHSYRGILH